MYSIYQNLKSTENTTKNAKKQPTENQKNIESLFLYLACQGAVRPPFPVTYSTVHILNLSFPKISTITNFGLKTEFGYETRLKGSK